MRAEKSIKYKELKDKKGTIEYNDWFLNYRPDSKLTQSNLKSNTSHTYKKSNNK